MPWTITLIWGSFFFLFSSALFSLSRWKSFCCIVCDGSWLLWNTQKTLPSSGAASFRQSCHRFFHALFPPGSSVCFTWSGWNTGQPSLWVMISSPHVRTHQVFTQNTSPQAVGDLLTPWRFPTMLQNKPIYHPYLKKQKCLISLHSSARYRKIINSTWM